MPADPPARRTSQLATGTADQAAEHQPDRRRHHGEAEQAQDVVFGGKALGIGGAGAMAARQGDGAGNQPQRGVQAKQARDRHPQDVLRQQKGKQGDKDS